ncbi:MAG TPA: energy-coupling factor transporter transmembrane component T [Candidatus Acidoferrales bacterium]|nr:energy-coupling factor transporter transmembrane component T [Candidatus Acidoferrales bacterium]
MNPRALAVWVAAVLLLSLGSEDPILRVLTLGAALAVLLARRRAGTRVRPALWAVGIAAMLTVLFNFALSHTGQNVLLELPGWLPALGGPLTLEGAVYGLDLALGLGACIVAGICLSLVVEPYQLVDALPALLSRTGAALGAAMTLVPRLGHSFAAVREAQQMRGWRPRGMRSWTAVVVPSVLTTIEGSVLLAEAMEARAFGSGPRTALATSKWRVPDLLIAATSGAAIAGFVLAMIFGQVPSWQPYPSLILPGLNWWPTLCCLALFTPALRS